LRRYETFVMTRERICEERFPFSEERIEEIPRARKNFIKRFWLKYVMQKPPVYYRGELQVLIKMLKRRPANLMHAYFGHTGVHLLPFIKEWECPCVVSFHGMDIQPRPEQEGYDDQMRELLKTVPLVLARSHSLFAALEAWGCPTGKLRLNRAGVPLGDFEFVQRPMPADGSWRFVQACRLVAKKGLRTALRAFAKFRGDQPKAKFVIAGEGPMREELEDLATELGVRDAVEFRGFLSQKDLAALYGESHVFLHPSEVTKDKNQEGVPNSMLEAMATGLPVLATRHGGIPEAVTHERHGLLVPEGDVDALHAAMRHLTSDAELCYVFGQAASRQVREEFELSRAIDQLESIYDEVLATSESRTS